MAALPRSVATGIGVRPPRLREVHERDFRTETTLVHLRAAEALILASLPLDQHFAPPVRGVAERVVALAREQT